MPGWIWQEVNDADLLVAAIGVEEEELRLILGDVQGEPRPLTELGWELEGAGQQQQGGADGTKRDKWKKMYKITDDELAMSSLEDCVVMRMAVKDH